jgi:CRP/FNR family cyclic AMP-dependent transcriptional regulator
MKTEKVATINRNIEPKQAKVKSANPINGSANFDCILEKVRHGKSIVECHSNHTIFRQGQPANSVFYLQHGKVKLTATSKEDKEAIVAVINGGEFFGEGCLIGQSVRMATASAMMDSTMHKIEKPLMMRLLHKNQDVSKFFVQHLLSRNARYEEDLVDQLFNNSEKRLARILLLLVKFGKDGVSKRVRTKIDQESLAKMVGITRARVSYFMNKFNRRGFIDYIDGNLTVHNSLLEVVLGSLSEKGKKLGGMNSGTPIKSELVE